MISLKNEVVKVFLYGAPFDYYRNCLSSLKILHFRFWLPFFVTHLSSSTCENLLKHVQWVYLKMIGIEITKKNFFILKECKCDDI